MIFMSLGEGIWVKGNIKVFGSKKLQNESSNLWKSQDCQNFVKTFAYFKFFSKV